MAAVVVVDGTGSDQSCPLSEAPLTIGRLASNQLQLYDRKVSRKHTRIEKRPDGYYAIDLDSSNGTYVNGTRVHSTRLSNGDRIQVGNVVLMFLVEGTVSFSEAESPDRLTVVDASMRPQDAKIVDREHPAAGQTTLDGAQTTVEILHRLAELATSSHDANVLVDEAMDLALELVGADRGFICLTRNGPESFVVKTSRPKASNPEQVSLSKTILHYAVRRGESVLCADLKTDPRFTGAGSGTAHRIRSAIYVPLKVREQLIGMLGVDTPRPHKKFSREDLEYLSVFSNHLAIALQNAELRQEVEKRRIIEAQLQTARDIQAKFLPSELLQVRGLDYAAKMVPAMYVGGDFYDWLPLGDGRIAFSIGDVCGKGIPAALSMARTMGCLRAHATTSSHPDELMKAVNESLRIWMRTGMFTTMVFALFDADSKTLEFAVAGNPSPILYKNAKKCSQLASTDYGPALGVLPNAEWPKTVIELSSDDVVVLYTDGVSESLGRTLDMKPLRDAIDKVAHFPAEGIVEGILENVLPDEAQQDDAALLALKVL